MKPKPKKTVVVQGTVQEAVKKGEIVRMRAPLPAPPTPKNMLQVIAEAAMNPACDVEKMKALMEMQRQLEADEARRAFTRDFNALQAELPTINRDGKIDHGKDGTGLTKSGKKALTSRYATYPNIMTVIGPLLRKYGFTLSNVVEPSADGARIVVVGYLEHIEGQQRVTRFPMTIDTTGQKNNQQGWGSSQQYCMRYNAIALLNIVSKAPQDSDRDGHSPPVSETVEVVDAETGEVTEVVSDFPGDKPLPINQEQFAALVEAISDCGVGDKAVLDKYRIKKLTDLPAKLFSEALAACKNYKQAKARSEVRP